MRRRVVLGAAAVICLTAGVSAPAAAHAPSAPAAGTSVCTPTSKDVTEISGLVAFQGGFYAIQDSQPAPAKPKIFVIDQACKLVSTINYPTTARDPEDAAMDKNGTLYIADTGDNDESAGGSKDARPTVAIWTMASGAKTPTINRLTFPDGKKHDAEALLINGDGLPVIITKTAPSEVWVPEGALVPNTDKGVKLKKVGTFTALDTKTPNPLNLLGWKLVTGAAASPDGSKVVIRTLSDAYEFDVPGGDVVKAITSGKPRITPLPNEQQGEAITYSLDGKSYITASDVGTSAKAPLLKYAPTDISATLAGSGGGGGKSESSPKAKDESFLKSLTLDDITYAVSAIGLLGLSLVVAGVIGIRRSRAARRREGPAMSSRNGLDPQDADFATPATVGSAYGSGAPGSGNVYGAGPGGGGPGGGGGVYGGQRGAPDAPGGGNVYGGQGGPGGGRRGGGGGQGGGVYGGGGGQPGGGVYGGGGNPGGGVYGGSSGGGGGGGYGGGGGRGSAQDYGGSADRGGYGHQSGWEPRAGYGHDDLDGYAPRR